LGFTIVGLQLARGKRNILGILSVSAKFEDIGGRRHAIGVFGHPRNFLWNRADNIGRQLVNQVRELKRLLVDGEQ